ncbi:hypothetical protein ACIP5Y_23155 [Nocardia sp. NPDC088792]|uniref:hypothetical protein n=1 Tax=Nocardia sp. NPDC088792 TaxID=3364332 RepID=UPI0038032DE4
MSEPRRRRLWWVRPIAGAVAALALVVGGLAAFTFSDSGQQAHPRPVTEVPAVTSPLRHWPGAGN